MRLRRFLPRTLLGRALLILLVPVILAQLVATYIFFDRHWENLSGRLAYGVAGDIALAVASPELIPVIERHTDLRITLGPAAPLPPGDADGMINHALTRALGLKLEEGTFAVIDRAAEKLREVRVLTPSGLMTIEIPERRLSSPTAPVFLLWMMGSSAVFFAIAVVFLKNQIKPIRRLSVAAESFGKGQEVEGFKPEGALEVRRAAQAFIVMRERIKRQIRQRTEMLAGVSHDLRTPLTRMKLQLALMKPQEGLDELVADVADMELMVEGFLAFARGADGETSEQTDLTDLLESVVHDARRASGRDIALDLPPACPLVLRPHAMRRCFSNLVSNALRHAKCVRVSVEEAGTAVFVNIEDDGPGIPENRRAEALRPFVRLEDSRNPDTGGVGLGLTIASDIARSHGGDLSLGISSALGGLKVMVRLPH